MPAAELENVRRTRDIEVKMRTPYDTRGPGTRGIACEDDGPTKTDGLNEGSRFLGPTSLSVLARDSTLSTVRHLETIIEEQGLKIIGTKIFSLSMLSYFFKFVIMLQ